jgi:predicted lipoprotein with Yx(FWY)xxD motif
MRALRILVAPAVAAMLVAGCGSSSASKSHHTTRPHDIRVSGGTPVDVQHVSLGSVLVAGSGHRTVYMFTAGKCTGACAATWPPVTGTPKAGSGVASGKLGTTQQNGVHQITYAGHALFYYSGDSASGQTNGEGISSFGGSWYAVSPGGSAVKKSSAPASGGSGY